MGGMKEQLIPFYMAGRGVKSLSRLKKYVDDPDEIADKITEVSGATVRMAVGAACDTAAGQVKADKKRKKAFEEEFGSELGELTAAGDKDDAWAAYCQGMSDELAFSIEPEVLDALEGESEDDDDDDDDASDGDDGDESDDAKP
jgi:hypothetical protein